MRAPQYTCLVLNEVTTDMLAAPRYNQIPIIIGVTGHRDLVESEIPGIRRQIVEFLNDIRTLCPATDIILLTPLAVGADRLVAACALEIPQTSIFAALPFSEPEYEKDFSSPDSIQAFREFLRIADRKLVISRDPTNDSERDQAYESVGRWVARHSHILLTLWDGTDTQLKGGTAAIIRYKLDGCTDYLHADSLLSIGASNLVHVEPGRVLHIDVNRLRSVVTHPLESPRWISLSAFDKESNNQAQEFYNEIGLRNDQVLKWTERFNKDIANSRSDNLSNDDFYSTANELARKYKQMSVTLIQAMFGLAVPAILITQSSIKFSTPWHILFATITITIFLVLIGIYTLIGCKEKADSYRGLAEAVRVQNAWEFAGITQTHGHLTNHLQAADFFLLQQPGDLDWIRRAVRSVSLLCEKTTTKKISAEQFILIRDGWIIEQMQYFAHASSRLEKSAHLIKRITNYLFIMSLLFEAPHAISLLLNNHLVSESVLDACLYISSFCFAIASSYKAYGFVMMYEEDAVSYTGMHQLFKRAVKMLEPLPMHNWPKNFGAAQGIIERLGKESLAENSHRTIVRYYRNTEPPGLDITVEGKK